MKTESVQKLAKSSWQLPLMLLLLMAFLTPMIKTPLASMLMGVIYLLLLFVGLICGIIACCGVKTHGKKKILAAGITGIFLNVLIPSLLIAIAIPSFNKARAHSISNRMEMIAAEFNKSTPMLLDEETRLDNVKVNNDKSMTYTYTLVTAEKKDIDEAEFSKMMVDYLHNTYMTHPDMEWYRDQGIILNHKYVDKNGVFVTNIEIKKDLQPEA